MSQPPATQQSVYVHLKADILAANIAPGTSLSEVEIAGRHTEEASKLRVQIWEDSISQSARA